MSRHYVPVLTIAGSDSSGGAGIEADIKTIMALGGYAAAAITAITAQNTCGVKAIQAVDAAVVRAQVCAVMTDIRPRAVKIGMTGSEEIICAIADALADYPGVPVVVDPVMVATSGDRLADDGTAAALIRHLLPRAALLTPNLSEAAALTGRPVMTPDQRAEAARQLLTMGCGAVLIKGGHDDSPWLVTDRLYAIDPEGHWTERSYAHGRVATRNTHGTGCTLSAAIATGLALGLTVDEAIAQAETYVEQALRAGRDVTIGQGHGPVCHGFAPHPMIVMEQE
jgi:hydroxymethylpyrimidine/phosphomethylpyrimidine kinase